MIRPSNFNRHWSRQHPGMPLPDTRIRRPPPPPSSATASSKQPNGEIAVEPVHYSNEDNNSGSEVQLLLSDDEEDEVDNGSSATDEDFDGRCGYLGCKHVAGSKAELANHRRRSGHPKPRADEVIFTSAFVLVPLIPGKAS